MGVRTAALDAAKPSDAERHDGDDGHRDRGAAALAGRARRRPSAAKAIIIMASG